ncbi:MAG: nuclear transport factor 2 family protein [Flavobacteriaceae bacterium]
MKKCILFFVSVMLFSCQQGMHPDYEANRAMIEKFLSLQGSEADPQAQMDMVHPDLQWQPAFHASEPIGKAAFGEYLLGWQVAMEDVSFEARAYLPGVSEKTGMPDGSVRAYGTWSGKHSATGKEWRLTSYHTWDFKDGKIIAGGDYFDAGGLMSSLQPVPEMESED